MYSSTTSGPLYDFSRLGRLGQRPDFVREIKQMFIKRVPEQLAQLQTAVAAADWQQVIQVAHSLKSTFGNLKIEVAASRLIELEILAQQEAGQEQQQLILNEVAAVAEIIVQLFKRDLQVAA